MHTICVKIINARNGAVTGNEYYAWQLLFISACAGQSVNIKIVYLNFIGLFLPKYRSNNMKQLKY